MAEEFPDFELIPPDGDEDNIDEELADLVDPDEFIDPEEADEEDAEPIGRTILVDFSQGYAQGKPQWVSGNDAVVMIAQVALRTRRGESIIFEDDFGMDDPDALIGYDDDAERRADYEADVRETLLSCHERITSVGNFLYLNDPDVDVIYVDLSIEIDGEDDIRLEGIPLGG